MHERQGDNDGGGEYFKCGEQLVQRSSYKTTRGRIVSLKYSMLTFEPLETQTTTFGNRIVADVII